LIPMIEKCAWRYMQFAPELYPVKDFKFTASSSLGIIAREYEVTQLVQLLQTMDKASPMYTQLLESIIDHMNLSNREELIQNLRKSSQPTPEQQQAQQQDIQRKQAQLESQTNAFNGQAAESAARAEKIKADIALQQYEAETNRIKALSSNLQPGDEDEKEFQRRAKIAELYLKEQEINQKASQGVANANQQRMGQNIPASPPTAQNFGGTPQPTREPIQQAFGGQQTNQ
ncbi:MAG: hypothetical protein VW270_01635, partial [Candidatus Poseidoniales archaeon]